MTTIKLLDEGEFPEWVEKVFTEVRRAERERFGIPRISNIWRAMAHWPPYVEVTWRKAKVVRAPGRVDPLTKEMMSVAVSATNNCRY